MSTPLRLQAWKVINEEVSRRIAERDRELLTLIERAEGDLRQGWHGAAGDALGRARAILQKYAGRGRP
jgi:hypothetical protein